MTDKIQVLQISKNLHLGKINFLKNCPELRGQGKKKQLSQRKADLHPLKGVGNGKIDGFKELTPHSRTF